VESLVILASGLYKPESSDNIALDERPGGMDGIIDMSLRRVMDDCVAILNNPINHGFIGDVTFDEINPGLIKTFQVRRIASIGKRIQNGYVPIRTLPVNIMDKIGPDKSGAAGHKYFHHYNYNFI
jgi:hypothetical protein